MPSFDLSSTRSFWTHYMGGAVINIIRFMELSEHNMLSQNEEVMDKLQTFGEALDDNDQAEKLALDELVKVAASLHMSQKLRLMQVVDNASPGKATQMISYAELNIDSSPLAKQFLFRNKKFESIRILQKVYHPNRLQTLMSLYE